MVPLPTSNVRFLSLAGALLEAPDEWTPAWLQVLVAPSNWQQVEVFRNEQPLAVSLRSLGGEVCVIADWLRSGPGHYPLRIVCAGHESRETVTVGPRKLPRGAFLRMLEDLDLRLPTSVSLALQRTGALAGIKILPPGETTLAQELARLERAVRSAPGRLGLADVLRQLGPDPHRMLRSVTECVPRERSRRPDVSRLAMMLSRPGNLDSDRKPISVMDKRVEHSVDVYENRLVKAYWNQVDLRARRLRAAVLATRKIDLVASSSGLLADLEQGRRAAAFLSHVELPAHLPTRLTMVLLRRSPYRAALDGYIQLRNGLSAQLDEPKLEAPLEDVPRLYQIWGTLVLLEAFLGVAAELGYVTVEQRLVVREAGGLFVRVLPGGRPVCTLKRASDGTTVLFTPMPRYGSRGEIGSIGRPQEPDVAVEVRRPAARTRIWLFDPKYKLEGEGLEQAVGDGRPTKADMDKMHAYRDAIRDADGRVVVRYAAILYPGPTVSYAPGKIEALQASPGSEAALQSRAAEIFRAALAA